MKPLFLNLKNLIVPIVWPILLAIKNLLKFVERISLKIEALYWLIMLLLVVLGLLMVATLIGIIVWIIG